MNNFRLVLEFTSAHNVAYFIKPFPKQRDIPIKVALHLPKEVQIRKIEIEKSKGLRSNVVYKFLCGNCNVTYYGKTIRHLKVKASEHMGVSALTGKISNSQQSTAEIICLFVPIKLVLMIFQSLLLHGTILNLNLRIL